MSYKDKKTDETLDQEISALYQQRKNQLVAPDIDFNGIRPVVANKQSLVAIVGMLLTGGLISFGIMAIVSHFANKQQLLTPRVNTEVSYIELVPDNVTEKSTIAIPLLPVMPPKPVSELPEIKAPLTIEHNEQSVIASEFKWLVNVAPVVVLPHLIDAELLPLPSYKVLPEYSTNAIKTKQSGAVTLSYSINKAGKVTNINVIEANVSRELQKSAKQALAKWQYKPLVSNLGQQQVVFEFKLTKE